MVLIFLGPRPRPPKDQSSEARWFPERTVVTNQGAGSVRRRSWRRSRRCGQTVEPNCVEPLGFTPEGKYQLLSLKFDFSNIFKKEKQFRQVETGASPLWNRFMENTNSKIYDWFESRLEIQAIADDVTSKYVPPHVNIFYCFGGITFTLFLVQVATGFAMTFYYRPTVAEAFSSVEYLMTQVHFGWLIRSIHRWSASMMVLMMILHVFRVYLTGGFKKPRELTWVTGVLLAVCTVSFGVTGYSLPWDQVGYWAVKIVTGVPDALPVIGSFVVELLRGGVGVGQGTLTRFYSLHTFLLPLFTAVFMLMHFLMIRKQGISGPL